MTLHVKMAVQLDCRGFDALRTVRRIHFCQPSPAMIINQTRGGAKQFLGPERRQSPPVIHGISGAQGLKSVAGGKQWWFLSLRQLTLSACPLFFGLMSAVGSKG